jgi:selenocysteine lyase/cysteine desulfurase
MFATSLETGDAEFVHLDHARCSTLEPSAVRAIAAAIEDHARPHRARTHLPSVIRVSAHYVDSTRDVDRSMAALERLTARRASAGAVA